MRKILWRLLFRKEEELLRRQEALINGMSATCAAQRDLLNSAAAALARAAVSLNSAESDRMEAVAPAHGRWVN